MYFVSYIKDKLISQSLISPAPYVIVIHNLLMITPPPPIIYGCLPHRCRTTLTNISFRVKFYPILKTNLCHKNDFSATGQHLLQQEEIMLRSNVCIVARMNFLSQKEIYCHRNMAAQTYIYFHKNGGKSCHIKEFYVVQ